MSPCTDGGYRYEDLRERARLQAALCAVLSALTDADAFDTTLDRVAWGKAGISRAWLQAWWDEHQRKDVERIAREKAEVERREAAQAARAKLTLEELTALGLKVKP